MSATNRNNNGLVLKFLALKARRGTYDQNAWIKKRETLAAGYEQKYERSGIEIHSIQNTECTIHTGTIKTPGEKKRDIKTLE